MIGFLKEYLIPVLVIVSASSILAGFAFIYQWLKKILQKVEYYGLRQEAMDYALSRHFDNGYCDHVSERLAELMKKSDFINKK